MRDYKPESKKCSGCGYVHPSPWDDNCPVKKNLDKDSLKSIEFCENLKEVLMQLSNSEQIINSIKKLINLKGEKK
jgi:hypothetical protein